MIRVVLFFTVVFFLLYIWVGRPEILSENAEVISSGVTYKEGGVITSNSSNRGKIEVVDQFQRKKNDSKCYDGFANKIIDIRRDRFLHRKELSDTLRKDIVSVISTAQDDEVVNLVRSNYIDPAHLIGGVSLFEAFVIFSRSNPLDIIEKLVAIKNNPDLEFDAASAMFIYYNQYLNFVQAIGDFNLDFETSCLTLDNYRYEQAAYREYIELEARVMDGEIFARPENLGIFLLNHEYVVVSFIDKLIYRKDDDDGLLNIEKAIVSLSARRGSYFYIKRLLNEGVEFPATAVFIAGVNNNAELLMSLKLDSVGLKLHEANYDEIVALYKDGKIDLETFEVINDAVVVKH